MAVLEFLKPVGEFMSSLTAKVIELIPTEFIKSETTAKIVSLIVYALVLWMFLHFATSLKKPIKYTIVGLIILLIISVISTFIS